MVYRFLMWAAAGTASLYTLNYAWWAFRRRLWRGGVGLTALALLCALAPLVAGR